jgi:hypothetical protein
MRTACPTGPAFMGRPFRLAPLGAASRPCPPDARTGLIAARHSKQDSQKGCHAARRHHERPPLPTSARQLTPQPWNRFLARAERLDPSAKIVAHHSTAAAAASGTTGVSGEASSRSTLRASSAQRGGPISDRGARRGVGCNAGSFWQHCARWGTWCETSRGGSRISTS